MEPRPPSLGVRGPSLWTTRVVPLALLLFTTVLEVLEDLNKASKRNKRQLGWRGRSKLSLFMDNVIYIKIRWKLINEFGEVAGYNFSI